MLYEYNHNNISFLNINNLQIAKNKLERVSKYDRVDLLRVPVSRHRVLTIKKMHFLLL